MSEKVIHLIPRDGLGGVEQAARSLKPSNDLDIQIAFVCGSSLRKDGIFKEVSGPKVTLNSPLFYINGFRYLINEQPDLLISSLWRSNLISIMYTLYTRVILKKELKLVVFLHATKFAHLPDKIATTILTYLADEIWCDSEASKANLFKRKSSEFQNKAKVISFFVRNKQITKTSNRKNNFVFWGRLDKAKRIDKGIKLFSKIHSRQPESLFYIYGPDSGELHKLKNLVKNLDLVDNVLFMGPKEPNHYPNEAKTARFFINTSSHEGMAIAVTEAMQLGIIPIVTPVGEIANYCINKENSIYYEDENLTAAKVLHLLQDNVTSTKLSENAISYWNNKPTYSQDFNANCLRIIKGNKC